MLDNAGVTWNIHISGDSDKGGFMLPFLMIAIAFLWIIGIPWFWHLQSQSRGMLRITIFDRLLAIIWLPAYLGTILFLSAARLWKHSDK